MNPTAIHEAGHVVVGHRFGDLAPTGSVATIERAGGGRTYLRPGLVPEGRASVAGQALALLVGVSGEAAKSLLTPPGWDAPSSVPGAWWGASIDSMWAQSLDLAADLSLCTPDRFESDPHWIAMQLCAFNTRGDRMRAFSAALHAARELVESHAQPILSVAAELDRKRVLTRADVDLILAATRPTGRTAAAIRDDLARRLERIHGKETTMDAKERTQQAERMVREMNAERSTPVATGLHAAVDPSRVFAVCSAGHRHADGVEAQECTLTRQRAAVHGGMDTSAAMRRSPRHLLGARSMQIVC